MNTFAKVYYAILVLICVAVGSTCFTLVVVLPIKLHPVEAVPLAFMLTTVGILCFWALYQDIKSGDFKRILFNKEWL